MKFYFNNQVFESLREAAKDYLQQICKYNEELRDNEYYYKNYSDIVDSDVSLEIYRIKDTDKYFFEVSAENVYTNSGNLLKMITDDSLESELIETFNLYGWTKEVDAEDIDKEEN